MSLQVNSGWYKQEALNLIKAIIRRKWIALTENRICSDNDCLDLVEEFYSGKRSTATGDEVSHGGRPKGGGGYAAGDIQTNSTVQSTSKKDKWKRKATARLPATAEDLTVSYRYPSAYLGCQNLASYFRAGCEIAGDAGERTASGVTSTSP